MRITKLGWYLAILAVTGAGFGEWALLHAADPIGAAKRECERQVEATMGYDLTIGKDMSMHVSGDAQTLTLQVAIVSSASLRTAECTFEAGTMKRLAVDGAVISGS